MIGTTTPIKPVPISYFLGWIEKVTGWNYFLENHDLGDLERELGFRVKGERFGLYRIVGTEEIEDTRRFVDKLLEDFTCI